MNRLQFRDAALVAFWLILLGGCAGNIRGQAPAGDGSAGREEARDEVRDMANAALRDLYARRPQARSVVEGATGYAVFSNFGMKILVAGGGTGEGLAVEHATRREVFMRMAELQAGLGFGVKKFRLVWVFQTKDAFDSFVDSGYQFGGQAALSARAGGAGADVTGAVSVAPGVWIYQLTDDGVAAELTVKGTRYYRNKALD
ncbi:hypothetical protein FZO89_06595 [Luteimonas viscosa]|uniref:Ysc84 actin-binding domain-containing protein n=1 Tax=Luteimonas viscosa TaxID=1132694 RepID=A0A5D4XMP4_9GAMM|nr:YSC84-related protein [Luteimonas viscosa]TYT25947.1 hypothetical protein FZO89_06595 [Luteimonas viscosa]